MTQLASGPPTTETPVEPRLRRSTEDKVIGGVCGGLGAYFGLDPIWFRLAFVVLAVGGGSGVLIYLLAWLLIPAQRSGETLVAREGADSAAAAVVGGLALVAVGLMLLANTLFPWFDRVMWPLVAIIAGLGLLYTGRRHER